MTRQFIFTVKIKEILVTMAVIMINEKINNFNSLPNMHFKLTISLSKPILKVFKQAVFVSNLTSIHIVIATTIK